MPKVLLSLLFLCLATTCASAQQDYTPEHPMDALTSDEIAQAVDDLRKAGLASDATLYPAITLNEMPKGDVLKWKQADALERQAFIISRDNNETRESVVDLASAKVLTTRIVPGAQPMILDSEWTLARDHFMADPRFKAALKRRGYGDTTHVFCTPNSAGYFPAEKLEGRRILRIPCFDDSDNLHHLLARPLEGLMGIVDSVNGEVIDVVDREVVPLKPAPQGYGKTTPAADPPLHRVEISAQEGSNIKLQGNLEVAWNHWSMHVRGDKRAGVIISLARFNDGDRDRLIAYQMNLSEIFVPYMDPNPTWNYRTFLDAGEFGLGYLISSLEPNIDCPPDAVMVDLVFPDDLGGSYVKPRALCIFERSTGDPAWRHYSSGSDKTVGRAETELVVRHIPTLGNYDYLIDYVFSPRGSIKVRVGATGFDAIKSSEAATMDDPTAADDTAYGTLVAPFTVAPNHEHYFNFRLDLDIDGPNNTFVSDQFVPELLRDSATRKSLWRVHTKLLATEGPVTPDHQATGGEAYRLVNMNEKNALGQNPSYWLHAAHSATSIMDPSDPPQQRGDFSKSDLWITQYQPDELYAAGPYPNLSTGGDGLPAFARDGAPLMNRDIVVWYSIAFRHAPKPEDFPVLPTMWHDFTLRPAFFFNRDPSSKINAEYAAPQE
jgi:primary-amine oxidase